MHGSHRAGKLGHSADYDSNELYNNNNNTSATRAAIKTKNLSIFCFFRFDVDWGGRLFNSWLRNVVGIGQRTTQETLLFSSSSSSRGKSVFHFFGSIWICVVRAFFVLHLSFGAVASGAVTTTKCRHANTSSWRG